MKHLSSVNIVIDMYVIHSHLHIDVYHMHTGIPAVDSVPSDSVVEMMPPVNTWGQTFIVSASPGQDREEESYLFVAQNDLTFITIGGESPVCNIK